MGIGWIKLHRSLTSHWIWTSTEPFDKRSAFVDLLLLANHKDFRTMYRGKLHDRKRGEVNTSLGFLADRWKWDKRKVKRFLMVLEGDGMVSVDSTADGTTITIENYEKYQSLCTTDGTTDGTTEGTTDGTSDGTYDNNGTRMDENVFKKDVGSKGITSNEKSTDLMAVLSDAERRELKEKYTCFEELIREIQQQINSNHTEIKYPKNYITAYAKETNWEERIEQQINDVAY